MSDYITATRSSVTDRFSAMAFTVHTDAYPKWFEVALATDPTLFRPEAKAQRTASNFFATRRDGPLLAERGEAVYLVPPDVLRNFVGQKVYYALATFPDQGRTQASVANLPTEGSPWVDLRSFSGRALRRGMSMPKRNGASGSYNGGGPALEWAGDAARPGTVPVSPPPAGTPPPAPAAGAPATGPVAQGLSASYDDGFGTGLWEQLASEADDAQADGEHGIEGPIPDAGVAAAQQSLAYPLTASEYPQANRFAPASSSNFRAASRGSVSRVVIHITDGGANINGTIGWFQNAAAQVSAHYVVGQDGEVVQMVLHKDVAWHARSANTDSIGIEHVANTRGLMPTEAEYCASAALVRYLCETFSIPMDRTHILGHSEADTATTHTSCPNAVWDWDYFMGMVASATCYQRAAAGAQGMSYGVARPFDAEIPLDPGAGGRSIDASALAVGDIILSTTAATVSNAIRSMTGAPVSHAMVYTGDGEQVVEAIGDGVTFRPLAEALADATVAVAFRHPTLTDDSALLVRDFVGRQIGKPYNYWGIVRQARFRIDSAVCRLLGDEARARCVNFYGRVNLGTGGDDSFFCSQLVLAAYEAAGLPLTSSPPNWASPGEVAELQLAGTLNYVGHLKAPPLSSGQGLGSVYAQGAGNGNGNGSYAGNGQHQHHYEPQPGGERQQPVRQTGARSAALGNQSLDFNWGDAQLVPQLTGMSCWAAAASMVVGWRDYISINPDEIARGAGRWAEYTGGLNPSNRRDLATAWGLVMEGPQCYTVEGFYRLLVNNGPLWVGVAVPSGHAVVVTGMYGDGTPGGTYVRVNDPWPPGQGAQTTETYEQFQQEYENRMTVDSRGDVNVQILHSNGRRPLPASLAYSAAPPAGARGAAPSRTERQLQAVEVGSAIVGAVMTRVLDNKGDVEWELDQLQGLKSPGNNPADAGTPPYSTQVISVEGPHAYVGGGIDHIYADHEITFQYNGRSLGNVQVSTVNANDAFGMGLVIKETIMDDANSYTNTQQPGQPTFAAIKVRFHYRFTNVLRSDLISITDYVLYGNGTYTRQSRWTQTR
jgi:N-acetyl-anhydromuramyl-L-alanine amidase AmpD/uncharacterized protein YycO